MKPTFNRLAVFLDSLLSRSFIGPSGPSPIDSRPVVLANPVGFLGILNGDKWPSCACGENEEDKFCGDPWSSG
jgi:hypothetical protein